MALSGSSVVGWAPAYNENREDRSAHEMPGSTHYLYDFFTNRLPHFYGETCLIWTSTSHQLAFGKTPGFCPDEDRLNPAGLVKF